MQSFSSNYSEKEEIGEGPIGTVRKVLYKPNNELRVIKYVEFSKPVDDSKVSSLGAPLINLKGPGLAEVFDVFQNTKLGTVNVIEEYLDNRKYNSLRLIILRNSFSLILFRLLFDVICFI
jgi:hypothetical protein